MPTENGAPNTTEWWTILLPTYVWLMYIWRLIYFKREIYDNQLIVGVIFSFFNTLETQSPLTHWGRVRHICVTKLTIICSNNGLSPGWYQAIIRTDAGILLIRPLGTKFGEILIEIHIYSSNKMHLKKLRKFCFDFKMLKYFCTF